jgi:hypothetical protein
LTLTPAGQRLVREVTERRRAELVAVVDTMPVSWLRPVSAALRSLSESVGEPPETEWWLGWANAPEAEAS